MKDTNFDEALPEFAGLIHEELGADALTTNAFLRDAEGSLTFVIRDRIDAELREKVEEKARTHLGMYVASKPCATPSELFDDKLSEETNDIFEAVEIAGNIVFVRLIERRLVGQDWLRGVADPIPNVPVVAFASHKGGVGRSTALSVAAIDFARRGKRVLCIDFDLEAPGIGASLLSQDRLGMYGVLDYFVENSRRRIDEAFFRNMLIPAPFDTWPGAVFVAPATGLLCQKYPQNVLGKLARAYLEDPPTESGQTDLMSFRDQARVLVTKLAVICGADLVFVDARAGLNETTGAVILGLGADILLFGGNSHQTWEGYRYYLAHLARFKSTDAEQDWRYRIKMVHAKAIKNELAPFRDKAFELFAEHLYDEADVGSEDPAIFNFDLDEPEAPHYAWPIFMNDMFYTFAPDSNPEQLSSEHYRSSYEVFLSGLWDRLGLK